MAEAEAVVLVDYIVGVMTSVMTSDAMVVGINAFSECICK